MIVSDTTASGWQESFLAMLPEIQRRLRRAFRFLELETREEAIEEAVLHCLLWYARLHEQQRAHVATPASLASYAARHVKRGRTAASRLNSQDVLSRYAQLGRTISIDVGSGAWIDDLVCDQRASVADQVAAKLDVRAWWETLTSRWRTIAGDLAIGGSTKQVAARHGLTAGRISQIRRALADSWAAFQGEAQVV